MVDEDAASSVTRAPHSPTGAAVRWIKLPFPLVPAMLRDLGLELRAVLRTTCRLERFTRCLAAPVRCSRRSGAIEQVLLGLRVGRRSCAQKPGVCQTPGF